MIRGVLGVVPCDKAEVGRFYLWAGYERENWFFQCVAAEGSENDGGASKALLLMVGETPRIKLTNLPSYNPLIALYDVHVRVDPTSLDSQSETGPSRFFLFDDLPAVCANIQNGGWQCINVSTGRLCSSLSFGNKAHFTRWSLVIDDDAGDELTVASFDYSAMSAR